MRLVFDHEREYDSQWAAMRSIAEKIGCRGPWRHLEAVEFATLDWVDWFNTRRRLEPIGHVPPAEYEEEDYRRQDAPAMVAGVNERALWKTRYSSLIGCKNVPSGQAQWKSRLDSV